MAGIGLLGALGGPVGLAAGIGSTLLGGLLGRSGPSKEEKAVLANQAKAQQLSMGIAQPLASQGLANSGLASDYWSRLLSGDRASATAAAAPDILRIGQGYDAAARSSAALSPRGGPSAEFLAEQPFNRQRDVSLLLGSQRGDAASKVGAVGSSQLANAIQALYGSSAAGREILNSEQARKQADAQRSEAIGTGLFDVLTKYGDVGGKPLVSKLMALLHRGSINGSPSTGTPSYNAETGGYQ